MDELTGYRTQQILCVPIKNRREEILGVLELLNKRTGSFTPEDEEVLSLLATQIGIAMTNAQIYDGLRTSLDRLSRLMKVGAAISSELDLDALLRTISQTTSHLLQAERSTVFVVDPVKNELWSRVAEGLGNKEIRIPITAGIAGLVATTGNPVRISDAYQDPRFNPEVDKKTGYQTRSILCIPMRNRRGQVIGVFQVLNKRDGEFTPLDEQLLASLSSQAAVAVENAKLYEEVQRTLAQVQALDRMKTDFLNAISHELRTPLAPILGYTEILLAGGMGGLPAGAVRGVQAIADSGKRLLNLIESLLAFIRLDQGEMALKRVPVNVSPLLSAVVEAFRARAAEQKLTLCLSAPDGVAPPPGRSSGVDGGNQPPGGQRDQVHAGRGHDQRERLPAARRRRSRRGRDRGPGHGHRHPCRPAREDLRPVLPGRQLAHPAVRRGGDRAGRGEAVHRGAWEQRDGRERAREGLHVPLHAAGRRVAERRPGEKTDDPGNGYGWPRKPPEWSLACARTGEPVRPGDLNDCDLSCSVSPHPRHDPA